MEPAPKRQCVRRTFVARADGPCGSRLVLTLSRPEPDEVCPITMERIDDYQLDFLPAEPRQALVKSQPQLTRVELPCGHAFSALAVLYHFTTTAMTCPCCRSGSPQPMTQHAIPAHLRRPFARRLEQLRAEERREQAAEDAHTVAELVQLEVTTRIRAFLRGWLVELIVYAFDSPSSFVPGLAFSVSLSTSSPEAGAASMAFSSSGYSARQLSSTLRALPRRPMAFELAVGMRDALGEVIELYRAERFGLEGLRGGTALRGLAPVGGVELRAWPLEGEWGFARFEWTIPRDALCALILASVAGD